MKIYTIKQRMGGTGSIHDLASQYYDRDIRFPKGFKYAVVLAAYYGGRGYTVHRTEEAACRADRRAEGYSRQIIDADGKWYENYGDHLVEVEE